MVRVLQNDISCVRLFRTTTRSHSSQQLQVATCGTPRGCGRGAQRASTVGSRGKVVLTCKVQTAGHHPGSTNNNVNCHSDPGLPISWVNGCTNVDGHTCTVGHVNSAGVGATCESEHSDAFSRVSDGQVMCRRWASDGQVMGRCWSGDGQVMGRRWAGDRNVFGKCWAGDGHVSGSRDRHQMISMWSCRR
jgi:hypothetical protein